MAAHPEANATATFPASSAANAASNPLTIRIAFAGIEIPAWIAAIAVRFKRDGQVNRPSNSAGGRIHLVADMHGLRLKSHPVFISPAGGFDGESLLQVPPADLLSCMPVVIKRRLVRRIQNSRENFLTNVAAAAPVRYAFLQSRPFLVVRQPGQQPRRLRQRCVWR